MTRVKQRPACFRAVFRARLSRTWPVRESFPRQCFTHQFTQHIHALGPCNSRCNSRARCCRSGPRDAPSRACIHSCSSKGPALGCAVIAHSKYARLVRILGAYPQQVRTSGSQPPRREPDRALVIKSYGFQALVSTVVSTVLQCFSLVECRFVK